MEGKYWRRDDDDAGRREEIRLEMGEVRGHEGSR